jgi:hypothetical protein
MAAFRHTSPIDIKSNLKNKRIALHGRKGTLKNRANSQKLVAKNQPSSVLAFQD